MNTNLYTNHHMITAVALCLALLTGAPWDASPARLLYPQPQDAALQKEIAALTAAMVAAFKRDPASVAAFYTDDALIAGGGQRSQGRAAVAEYWKGATMYADWTLESLQTGGAKDAPWVYGRSVIVGRSGRTMETFFLGLLRRQPSGELRFQVDAFSRDRRAIGDAEAARIGDLWLKATKGNTGVMSSILENPLALLSPAAPQAAPPAGNAGVVEAVANAVAERYVFPDLAPKIAEHIRQRARQGAYDRLTGGELADALTTDLRVQNGDRHLYVQFQPGQPPSAGGGPVRQTPGSTPAAADLIRRRNYFLNRAERLDGNIGYLEVRRFFGQADEARDAIAGAMAFLSQTDAMIVDVRYAPGGDARMVDLLASYFFDAGVPTLSSYSRTRNETIHRTTLASVPGRRRTNIPVYVLTSRDTGSAAEDFAFLMQQTGRATLVGDRTAGAGHINAVLGLGGGYSVSVSTGRTFNPKTNEGWEATGVQPHVRAAAPDALDAAHRHALTALIDKASDASIKQELSWTRDGLDARRTPPVVDARTLQSYAGRYGARHVTFADGRLWYQRAADAEKIPLTTLSATEFAMGEGQRFQFVVTGGIVQMRLLMTDGTHVAYARS
jgi:ketosteroid isomerase-like protein